MKRFIKTWWHCLWRMTKDLDKGGHRMCYVKPTGRNMSVSTYFKPYWVCSCKL